MPRAIGNDLAELFGFAPDDRTDTARIQWKSQQCPFVQGTCIKHSHPRTGQAPSIFGTCSVRNQGLRRPTEEIILCPQRLYFDNYATLRACGYDAWDSTMEIVSAKDTDLVRSLSGSGKPFGVLFGTKSGSEVKLRGTVSVSLDWVVAKISGTHLESLIPIEVQSIDITGNYHACWEAYRDELSEIPNSKHGMNWANVWKRLIPQILLKGAIAGNSTLCTNGFYFVLPDRVYQQFEKVIGKVPATQGPAREGILTIMTYDLGAPVDIGQVRAVVRKRMIRMKLTDFAEAFASGRELKPLGQKLDATVLARLQGMIPGVVME